MNKKVMDNLDRIVAGVLIAACLGLVGARHLFGWERLVDPATVVREIKTIEDRIAKNAVPPPTTPTYAADFAGRMDARDRRLPEGLVSWTFYPIPPFEIKAPLPEPTFIPAELAGAGIVVADIRVARAVLKVVPRAERTAAHNLSAQKEVMVDRGQLIRTKDVLVWRKAGKKAEWDEEPTFVIPVKGASSALPRGVSRAADGFEIVELGLSPVATYEYRVRTVCTFHPSVTIEGKPYEVKPNMGDLPNILPPPEKMVLLDPPDKKIYATEKFSAAAKVTMPPDFQLQLVGSSELPDDKDPALTKMFARIKIRHYRPDAEGAVNGWIETTRDFAVNDNLAVPKWRVRIREGTKTTPTELNFDSGAALIKLETRKEKPPKGGNDEIDVLFAVVRDKATGEKADLKHARYGGEWWPKIEEWKAPPAPPVGPAVPSAPAKGPTTENPVEPAAVPVVTVTTTTTPASTTTPAPEPTTVAAPTPVAVTGVVEPAPPVATTTATAVATTPVAAPIPVVGMPPAPGTTPPGPVANPPPPAGTQSIPVLAPGEAIDPRARLIRPGTPLPLGSRMIQTSRGAMFIPPAGVELPPDTEGGVAPGGGGAPAR